jgi:nucleotide-binding universal stress UspA family protein
MKFHRILVPTDFSDRSLRSLDYAIDFARTWNAELLVVNVVEPIRHTRLISDVSELLENRRADAAEELGKLERQRRSSITATVDRRFTSVFLLRSSPKLQKQWKRT